MFSRFSSPPACQGKPRLVDEPPTPAPLRRLRPPRPEPKEKNAASTTAGSEEAAADKQAFQAVHFGPRPRIVHFDLPGVEDEEEVSGSYYPPGVPVPPSRLQVFANRPRRRKVIWETPSQEVQIAMAQLRAEIQAMENPPPTSWIGRLMESLLDMYRNKRDYRRNHGLAERPGFVTRMKRRLAPVPEAMRRFLYLKKNTDDRQLPTGIDSTLCDYILHCEHPDPNYPPIISLTPQLLETALCSHGSVRHLPARGNPGWSMSHQHLRLCAAFGHLDQSRTRRRWSPPPLAGKRPLLINQCFRQCM
ncbi:uncharacterized protein LOC126419365 [Schistocerca serialis cubense]|uniref:uncharacterized protein LOC126419365 n=1 Tax=Schistocerca serialis cubense TaxID=2023355 RepID=UPI00214E9128|nr:uncharacterized protein LOC126419365 [Schistocerca serialis cubense]